MKMIYSSEVNNSTATSWTYSTLNNTLTLTVEESEGFQAQEQEQQDNIQYQIGLCVREDHSYNQQSKHGLLHRSNLNR